MAPTLFTSCNALQDMTPTLPAARGPLPPEGAAAPAAWQSQFRDLCWWGSDDAAPHSLAFERIQ